MVIVCQLGVFLSMIRSVARGRQVGVQKALKMNGIVGEDPVHPPVDFSEQAVSRFDEAGAHFLGVLVVDPQEAIVHQQKVPAQAAPSTVPDPSAETPGPAVCNGDKCSKGKVLK